MAVLIARGYMEWIRTYREQKIDNWSVWDTSWYFTWTRLPVYMKLVYPLGKTSWFKNTHPGVDLSLSQPAGRSSAGQEKERWQGDGYWTPKPPKMLLESFGWFSFGKNGMLLLFRADFSSYFWVGPCSFVDMFPVLAILSGSPGRNWVYGVRHVRLVEAKQCWYRLIAAISPKTGKNL